MSRTPSSVRGAVHRIYLGRTVTATVDRSSMNLLMFSSQHDSSSLHQGLIPRRLLMTVGVITWITSMKFLYSSSCVINVLSVFPSRIVPSYPLHKVLQAFSHKLGVENFLHFILILAVDEDCWGSRRDVARMRIARDRGQERDWNTGWIFIPGGRSRRYAYLLTTWDTLKGPSFFQSSLRAGL